MTIFIFISWILFAVFSAFIANAKNRSSASWFFIGLIFGPFGLVVGLLPSLKSKSELEAGKNQINCQYCGEQIQWASKICKFCSTKFPNLTEPARSHMVLIEAKFVMGMSSIDIANELNHDGIKCAINEGVWNAAIVDDAISAHISSRT